MFQKFWQHLKFLGARTVIWSKFHTEDPLILGATVQNLDAMTTWNPGFVHPWHKPLLLLRCSLQYFMFDLIITFENNASVWIIVSLQQHGTGNSRVLIVRSCNAFRTKDSSTWHLKLLQLTLAIQCPVWFCLLVMENFTGEVFPAWHSSPRHITTHTSNTQNTTLVQDMFLNTSSKQARTYLIMARRSVTSPSLYKPSYVGIICIYPIIYDDHMWRSVQAKKIV
jgi:hypothetical protein